MARGQSSAADTQLKTTNAVAGQEGDKANQLESKLVPGYTSLMDTGYFSPEEEAAATTSEMGAATQPFESAGFKAANRAAATRNPADLTAQEDQLALDEGRTAGDAAAKLQEQKMSNQEAGMYGLGQLQQGDQHAMEQMYGLGPSTLGARAAGPGWSQGFKDVGTTISSFGKQS
jgi:hypothetical protein